MKLSEPETTDMKAVFRTLTPSVRLTALVGGVLSPLPYGAVDLVRMLRLSGLKAGGRNVTATLAAKAAGALERRGIAKRSGHDSRIMTIEPLWTTWLTREAHRLDLLEPIRAAHDKAKPSPYGFGRPGAGLMKLRCATVAGRFDLLPKHVEDSDWGFLAQPGSDGLLAALPEQHREAALRGCVDEVVQRAAPPEPVVTACREIGSTPERFAVDVAFIRILQGRLDDAPAVFDELPSPARDDRHVGSDRGSAQALTATLRGDDDAALRSIKTAIAAERAATRHRTRVPRSIPFILSLLSLVRADSPANRALLADVLHAGRTQGAPQAALDAVESAAELRAGTAPRPPIDVSDDIRGLLNGLVYCWAKRVISPYVPRESRYDFGRYVDRLAAHGFHWAHAECLAIIGDAGTALNPRVDRPPAALGEQGAALHRQLGTRTLVDVVPASAKWEFPLRALERFAFEIRGKEAKAGRSAESRLIWELQHDADAIIVTPREQRRGKDGGWTKGGVRSLQWLLGRAGKLDVLRAQDRAAAQVVKREQFGLQTAADERLTKPMLFELAGHPHVFNAAGDSVDVVRTEPELVIEQKAGDVHAVIMPDDWDGERYHVRLVGARRCEVIRLTADHHRVRKIIPKGGLTLPAEAGPRLLEAASALVPVMRIHGGVDGSASSARLIKADAQPRVRLEPYSDGLAAAVVVEPVPGSGAFFAPGAGGALVFGRQVGESVQARRDLTAEREAAERLAAACPRLAGTDAAPWSVEVADAAGALELLEQLDAAGARCLWPQGERFKIVGRADTRQFRLKIKAADEWVQASGQLRIDERRALNLKQLFALLDANPGSRFLELAAGEFLSLTASFRRQLDDLRSVSSLAARGAQRLHPLAALGLHEWIDRTRLDADPEWRARRQRLRDAQEYEPEVPSTLQAELRPYQQEGFRWLSRLSRWGAGACLADDMGLGKTVQALALLLERAPDGPALVVVPTSVAANWIDEARRFAPTLNVRACIGAADARAAMLEDLGPFDLVVTTYALLHIDAERLCGIAWHSAVLDEAQAIKNPAAKRSRAARALEAGFRMVTTGTPIQNNLTDLHSLFSFINPGMLGSLQQFRRIFATPIEAEASGTARARLRRMVAPFVLRRLKSEVLEDLPPRTEVTLRVELSPAEASFYEALRRRAVEDLEALRAGGAADDDGRMLMLAHLTRLRRACCNPALVSPADAPPSSKLAIFAETLAELLANRHKVLVFSQFVGHLKLIEARLQESEVSYQYLDGSTAVKARRERVAAFQAGQGDVFLISLTAGGVGLNLTAADYVIHMDPWWNPAVEDQASDRAHRIGQSRPVTIYRLVTTGTIEEQIVDLHHSKRELAGRLLATGGEAARLDPAELLELLRQPLA
ncbi:MAG: DEAD/DEAH box helicase [Spirochaetaceae bacterium]|nr:DEAD/DEAH box helicase [Spirochaetaceae bacterium]